MTKYTVEAGSGWRATLDGKQVLYAQEADDEAGYVLAPLVDAKGKPIFDHQREQWAIVRREGKIEVQKSTVPPEERVRIALDNPFRVERAREGELTAHYQSVGISGSGEPGELSREYTEWLANRVASHE